MVMKRQAITGCCASANFHDLGVAHGHPRYGSVEDFKDKLVDLQWATINIAITNGQQNVEREYLKASGFKVVFKTPTGLHLHAAGALELAEALKEQTEKKKRNMYAAQEKQYVAAEKRAKEFFRDHKKRFLEDFSQRVLATDVDVLRNYNLNYSQYPRHVDINVVIKKFFGVTLPNGQNNPYYSSGEIARWINVVREKEHAKRMKEREAAAAIAARKAKEEAEKLAHLEAAKKRAKKPVKKLVKKEVKKTTKAPLRKSIYGW